MSTLRLHFLGPPRIERGGQVVETDTRKAIALLAYLALTGEYHTRDALATLLWPDFDDQRARAALRRTLSVLKRGIGEGVLYITRDTIGLQVEQVWCDGLLFRQLLAAAPTVNQLETAVSLYRDDFLAGFSLRDSLPFDEWQLLEAENLRRDLLLALEQLTRAYMAQKQYEPAIQHARHWLQRDPLREETHRLLMQLYAWTGRRSAALHQYRDCVRVLEEELGVPPLAETTALYQDIQHDRLDRPQPETPLPTSPIPVVLPAPTPLPLTGREPELTQMQQLYSQIRPNGDGRLLVVAGEAGIGKTYLAEAFLVQRTSVPVLRTSCYSGESHLTYAALIQTLRNALQLPGALERLRTVPEPWLAETGRLLPELTTHFPDLPAPPPLDWPGAAARFFEGISQVLGALLTGSGPGILWLDDVQWADTATLEWLTFLVRRLQERPLLVLLCWREGDLAGDHVLRQLLAETRRNGTGQRLLLNRLSPEQVQGMVTTAVGDVPADLQQRLYRETEGLPILVSEYLLLLQQTGNVPDWKLPPTARDLFQSRLLRVGDPGQQLLQAAAVIGRAFPFELLQVASGRSEEEVLTGLELLTVQDILAEEATPGMPASTYHFSHHKLRELVYEEMSLVRRRLLHRRVAQALSARAGGEGLAGEIALHYQQGGVESEAAVYYRRAGDEARALFAHQEALRYYQLALALGHAETAELHEACGDLHTRRGEYQAALTSYEQAAAQTPLPHLEHKIGQVYYRRGDWELAESYFARAEAGWPAGDAPSPHLAYLYIDWSYTAYRRGDLAQAIRLANQAHSLAQEPKALAQTHNMLGVLARHQGEVSAAQHHFIRSQQLAEEHGFWDMQITVLNNLALLETAGHNPLAAQQLLHTALQLCLSYGDRHWEAALRNNLADALHQGGAEEEAMAQLKQAVTIYAEIGRETGQWQPEIWKLMEW